MEEVNLHGFYDTSLNVPLGSENTIPWIKVLQGYLQILYIILTRGHTSPNENSQNSIRFWKIFQVFQYYFERFLFQEVATVSITNKLTPKEADYQQTWVQPNTFVFPQCPSNVSKSLIIAFIFNQCNNNSFKPYIKAKPVSTFKRKRSPSLFSIMTAIRVLSGSLFCSYIGDRRGRRLHRNW